MPGIHVRDLSEDTVRALKRRALAHHRSLQGEVTAILTAAAKAAPPEGGYAPIRLHHVDIGGGANWTRDEVYGDDGR